MAKPMLITVNGTGVPDPFGPGFSGDVGRAFAVNPWAVLADMYDGLQTPLPPIFWQPIGYPAAVTPMNPSIAIGRAEVNRQISLHEHDGSCPVGTPLALSGYSQGAIVTGQVWAYDILEPTGIHHNRLNDVIAVIQFGDPLRSPGIANGNTVAGFPQPKKLDGDVTGGIGGPLCLHPAQTPDLLLSCALDGDLYASAPIGTNPWTDEASAGKVGTGIYNIIMQASFFNVISIAKDLFAPIGTVEEIINGIGFAAKGMNAPHWQYEPFVPAMVNYLLSKI